jgi:dihydroflavonol-4-reductase
MSIKALARQESDTTFLKEKGVSICYGDLLDVESLKAAMRDVNAVFHCAAAVREKRKPVLWKINCLGTEHLLNAARDARVEKFIHVSTIGIYLVLGLGALSQPAAEMKVPEHQAAHGWKAALIRPPVNYASSKLAAERKVWDYARIHGLKTVIIRPTLTVGERDRAVTKLLMNLAQRKVAPVIDGGKGLVPFVHAKDVARALVLASQSERAVGNSYDVEGFSVSMREGIEFFIEALGGKAKILNIPYRAAYLGACLAEGFLAIAQASLYPLVTRNLVRLVRAMATGGLILDTSRTRSELGFEPRYGMEESFRRAIGWQLEQRR